MSCLIKYSQISTHFYRITYFVCGVNFICFAVLGPATVDFGQVCLRSQSQKELSIINNLNRFIHVEVNVSIFIIFYRLNQFCIPLII